MINPDIVLKNYENAREVYRSFGIDTEAVISRFRDIPLSMHCWQGDDIRGFENISVPSENIVTGNYPGRARGGDELRADIETVFSLVPSKNRVSLHSIYAEPSTTRDRADYAPEDFRGWIDWAKRLGIGLDYNPTFFAHPKVKDGFTLASRDKDTRDYWVRVGRGSREIAAAIGRELASPCWNDLWVPDGMKDTPANRLLYRELLCDSLDRIYSDTYSHDDLIDVVEGKLFGIGLESYTVGSHDFYLAYAIKRGLGVCMDIGHYHPTESVADKISAVGPFVDNILLHVTRGVRWDSDHVVTRSDELDLIMSEINRAGYFGKTAVGLDFFDASINRVAAWVIGMRAAGRSILNALLEPAHLIQQAEAAGDYTSRLALAEEFKNLPSGAVWDMLCFKYNAPVGTDWIGVMKKYEEETLSRRK